MKKTLITLAALAASVASAATLNFNTATDDSTVDFTGADTIILTGATTLDTPMTERNESDWTQSIWTTTITSGDVTVTAENTKRLFGVQGDGGLDNGTNRVLNGATIDFGANGSLMVSQEGNLNLAEMNLTFKLTLDDLYVYSGNTTLEGTKAGEVTRTFFNSDAAVWNNNGNFNAYTVEVVDAAGNAVTSGWSIVTPDANSIAIKYDQTYAVPEPATATLSLLALAGLAARRRRK